MPGLTGLLPALRNHRGRCEVVGAGPRRLNRAHKPERCKESKRIHGDESSKFIAVQPIPKNPRNLGVVERMPFQTPTQQAAVMGARCRCARKGLNPLDSLTTPAPQAIPAKNRAGFFGILWVQPVDSLLLHHASVMRGLLLSPAGHTKAAAAPITRQCGVMSRTTRTTLS
jgi:hypothetical protein